MSSFFKSASSALVAFLLSGCWSDFSEEKSDFSEEKIIGRDWQCNYQLMRGTEQLWYNFFVNFKGDQTLSGKMVLDGRMNCKVHCERVNIESEVSGSWSYSSGRLNLKLDRDISTATIGEVKTTGIMRTEVVKRPIEKNSRYYEFVEFLDGPISNDYKATTPSDVIFIEGPPSFSPNSDDTHRMKCFQPEDPTEVTDAVDGV